MLVSPDKSLSDVYSKKKLHHSLLITHHSLLTTDYSLLITHYSLFRLSAGLAIAALTDRTAIVIKAIPRAIEPARRNTHP